jgi:hypothetical protein
MAGQFAMRIATYNVNGINGWQYLRLLRHCWIGFSVTGVFGANSASAAWPPVPCARDQPGTDGPRSRLPSATPPLIMPAEEFPVDEGKPLGQFDRQQEACYADQGSVLEVGVQRLPSSADSTGRH